MIFVSSFFSGIGLLIVGLLAATAAAYAGLGVVSVAVGAAGQALSILFRALFGGF